MKKTAIATLMVCLLVMALCGAARADQESADNLIRLLTRPGFQGEYSGGPVMVVANNDARKKFFEKETTSSGEDQDISKEEHHDSNDNNEAPPAEAEPAPVADDPVPPLKKAIEIEADSEKGGGTAVATETTLDEPASGGDVPSGDEPGEEKTEAENEGIDEDDPSGTDASPETVEEREPQEEGTPRISAIEIQGNENVSTSEIMKIIRSKVGDPLLAPRVRSDTQAIFEMGYFTDVKVDTPYYAGGYKLIFRVQENPVVSKITILGNRQVETQRIQELMQTTQGRILNMKTLNADLNEINYYYDETLGYLLKPTHIKNVNWTPSGELILTIEEGMIIQDIKVTGSSLFAEEKLMAMVHSKPGDLFNTNDIKKDTSSISKFYEDEGYILDTVRPQVNYRDGQVTIQVIEAVVEDIRLDFADEKPKTKDYVVMRNIRTKKGEVLQRKRLQRDIERLNNLGYFSRVNVEPEPGSKPGNTILVFKLKEQKTGLATIGVGYSGGGSGALRSGITGAISYQERNLGGTGQGANFSWQRGVNIDAISVAYSNPAINENQDSVGISLFRHNYLELRQSLTNDVGDNRYAYYDDKRLGGVVTYGRRVTDDFRLFLSYRKEDLKITRNPNSQYQPIGLSEGSLNAASLGALFDTRNDVFDPVEGWYLDADYTYGGKSLGGNYDYNKVTAEVRKYIPIGRRQRSTIALRAWGGSVTGRTAPITETFYVGGTDSIRGYNENQFYGNKMLVLNAEYRFPLANIKFLKGAVFADAGNAWFPETRRKRL